MKPRLITGIDVDPDDFPDGMPGTGLFAWRAMQRQLPRYAGALLEDCDPRFAEWAQTVRDDDTPTNLVVLGTVGTGKTYGLYAVMRELLLDGHHVLFRSSRRLVRDGMDDRGTIREACRAQVLIVDDVGTEPDLPWSKEILFEVADERWNAQLPTAVASNLTKEQLAAWIGDRTADRWLSMAAVVKLVGESRREMQL